MLLSLKAIKCFNKPDLYEKDVNQVSRLVKVLFMSIIIFKQVGKLSIKACRNNNLKGEFTVILSLFISGKNTRSSCSELPRRNILSHKNNHSFLTITLI